MKRIALIVSALLVSFAAYSQGFGVVAGLTSSNASVRDFDTKTIGRYHIGVTANLPLVGSLSLQPEILYNRKGATVNDRESVPGAKVAMGYLEIGAQMQLSLWDGDTRLYGFLEPFVGYGLNDNLRRGEAGVRNRWYSLHKPEGGFALGAGLQLFDHLQASAKVYWNLGPLYNAQGKIDWSDAKATLVNDIASLFKDGNNFNGMSLSLTYYF
ncbi:MAG: outer membrane beta-barrel protein [Bacteroidia bacterium]|nr:outer membrane beta-barrel protein [Bacteroidia bacterium]